MAEASKQTVYIDVDDEITSIVEKVRGADKKIVALVLPKRLATLQSIVNMKLLKRTADNANKNIVLITSEASLLPLAGAVKIHVAKTLQSKPVIPPPPEIGQDKEIVADDNNDMTDETVDKSKTIGELAGVAAVAAVANDDIDEDTIDVDSIDDEQTPSGKGKVGVGKLKVPNFDKFRSRLFIIGGVLIGLVIFFIFASKVLPKANIVIKTNSVDVSVNTAFTANTDQKTLDIKAALLPATSQTTSQSSSQQIQASGKKNVGETASGSVSISTTTNCITPVGTVPAGTTITNGVVSYTTQTAATFKLNPVPPYTKCNWTSQVIDVTAANPGAKYNVAAGTQFSVTGYSATATNSAAMTGGSDKTINILTQADVDSAKQKASQDNSKAQTELKNKLKDMNLYALPATLQASKQTVESTAKVGEEASNVTVTVTTQYSMLGVKEDDLKKLIDESVKSQIDTKKQKISDYGLENATININSTKSPSNQSVTLQTTATAGTSFDTEALKQQITGKKTGDVKQMISELPNVEEVTVTYSPFWVNKAPKPSKITIVVEKQQASTNDSNNQ